MSETYSRLIVEKFDHNGVFSGKVSIEETKSGQEIEKETVEYGHPRYLTLLYDALDDGKVVKAVKLEFRGQNYYVALSSLKDNLDFYIDNVHFVKTSKGWEGSIDGDSPTFVKSSLDP